MAALSAELPELNANVTGAVAAVNGAGDADSAAASGAALASLVAGEGIPTLYAVSLARLPPPPRRCDPPATAVTRADPCHLFGCKYNQLPRAMELQYHPGTIQPSDQIAPPCTSNELEGMPMAA